MSQHPVMYPMHPTTYPGPWSGPQGGGDARYLLNAATTGAMVGATGAAAINLHGMRDHGISWQQALASTARTGLNAGIATAAAAAVGRTVAPNTVLSFAAALAAGTAVMYVLTEKAGGGSDV